MTLVMFHYMLNNMGYASFDGDGEIRAHVVAIAERLTTLANQLQAEGRSREQALRSVGSFKMLAESDDVMVTVSAQPKS